MDYKVVYDPKKPDETTLELEINEFNQITINVPDRDTDQLQECPQPPRTLEIWEWTEQKVKWGLPISIWAKWICDETDKFVKCFENDWGIVSDKLPKAIRENELERNKIKT